MEWMSFEIALATILVGVAIVVIVIRAFVGRD